MIGVPRRGIRHGRAVTHDWRGAPTPGGGRRPHRFLPVTVPGVNRTPDTGHRRDADRVTALDAAARVGVSERTIRRAIARGDLPAVKRHGVFVIEATALDAWRERRGACAPRVADPDRLAGREDALPAPSTALIGRERELAAIVAMLGRPDVRLLTLTGAGGIGKTRLAIEAARLLGADFADGVHVAMLAEVRSAGLVAAAIAERLGFPEVAGASGREVLVAALHDAQALLVLDNFEHVLEAAPLVADLLGSCPRLKLLVTSRALLRIGGEYALPVPPLLLADAAGGPSVGPAVLAPAVRLFADRARAILPSFALTPANTAAVNAICQRLGGLPLAIELAASQVTVLPPDALLARIDAHLPLPIGGRRDAPDRQRTMTDAIAWSYDLLPPASRRLFRRVGVFVGGFSLAAAEAVGAPAGDDAPGCDPVTALAVLVDASLIQRSGDDDPRFTMLEPIRAFALGRLAAHELDATLDALADWCLALGEQLPLAASRPGAERYLSRLAAEHANIRQVLEWLDRRRDTNRLLRLVVALGGYWYERNHYREGSVWIERALAAGSCADPALRGRALPYLALFLDLLGEPDRARALVAQGIALLRGHDDSGALALALIWQGAIELQQGEYEQASVALNEALAVVETIPDASLAAAMSARAWSTMGTVAHARGDLDAAARWHEQALATCREHGYLTGSARVLCSLADLARDQGNFTVAMSAYREALTVLGERSDLRAVIAALQGTVMDSLSRGQPERAARLLGAAAGLVETFGVPIALPIDRLGYERAMGDVRDALPADRFDEVYAAGRDLSLSEAIAEVLMVSSPAEGPCAGPGPRHPLSPRERDVLRLLAAGRRDREIAEALFISRRTAEGHVARIIAKLGVATRVEAARAAVALGLADPER